MGIKSQAALHVQLVLSSRKRRIRGSSSDTYDSFGRLTSITKSGSTKYFTYDACGNPTRYKTSSSGSTPNMVWTRGQMLESYNGNTFEYNASGLRTKKNDTIYYLDGDRVLAETKGDRHIVYEYGADGVRGIRLSHVDEDGYFMQGSLLSFKKDLLGNVEYIIESLNNTIVASYTYDAWGNTKAYDQNGNEVTPGADHIANINPFRWKGHYFDKETGLYYINGAYYDPEIGRFISPIYGNFAQSLYAVTNPLMFASNVNDCFSSLSVVPEQDDGGWWANLHWGWKLAIGLGVIIGLAVTTFITGGLAGVAAGGTFWASGGAALAAGFTGATVAGTGALATTATTMGAAFAGAVMGASLGAAFGAISNGGQGAIDGFVMGSIFGGIGSATSSGIGMAHQFTSRLANYAIQIGANGIAAGTFSVIQQAIFYNGQINWAEVGVAILFGGTGGVFYNIQGLRSLWISLGLTAGENLIGLFI